MLWVLHCFVFIRVNIDDQEMQFVSLSGGPSEHSWSTAAAGSFSLGLAAGRADVTLSLGEWNTTGQSVGSAHSETQLPPVSPGADAHQLSLLQMFSAGRHNLPILSWRDTL